MDTTERVQVDRDEERNHAHRALHEWELRGRTESRCLRCGGEYRFHVAPSAYRIECGRQGCFVYTSRGI